MAVITDNLHIIVPLGAAAFFMAMVAFVSIEQALDRH